MTRPTRIVVLALVPALLVACLIADAIHRRAVARRGRS